MRKFSNKHFHFHPGIVSALAAAVLFGVAAPFSKPLLERVDPWMLAALLYLGSGVGLLLWRLLQHKRLSLSLTAIDWRWLFAAMLAGGVAAPALLMWGLARIPASQASLLLTTEGVFTAIIAWWIFREHASHRTIAGMLIIVVGATFLAWPQQHESFTFLNTYNGALAILLACLCWGIDNNLTRKVTSSDAAGIAMAKGLAAGSTNLFLATVHGASLPHWPTIVAAAVLGFISYGASLALFVVALQQLGVSRTSAYFSIAPFFGAILALLLLQEPLTPFVLTGGGCILLGTILHLRENHGHYHQHKADELEHEHAHDCTDPHHQHDHAHDACVAASSKPHSHRHRHQELVHAHAHYPDTHHQHRH